MKKILLTLAGFMITLLGVAQSPNLMNYQGVARNAAGNVLPNQSISLRLNIRTGSATGAVVYSETRSMLTNAFGLFNVVVGSPGATGVTGTIAGINWTAFGAGSGSKFLEVEIDPNGGSSFTAVGSTQMVSVPYSLYAGTASPVGPAGGDLSGSYPNPTVIRLQGRAVSASAPINRNLLMWDAISTSWIPATAAQAGIVSGTGTLNYVPKWTPDGVTLGNSQIFDNGTAVGIGTTAPTSALTVVQNNSGVNLGGGAVTGSEIKFLNFGSAHMSIYNSGNSALTFANTSALSQTNTAGTALMTLNTAGNLGIGTTSPIGRVHSFLNSTVPTPQFFAEENDNDYARFTFKTTNAANSGNNFWTIAGYNNDNRNAERLNFWNNATGDLMSIVGNGNVGIGTTNPAGRLEVVNAGTNSSLFINQTNTANGSNAVVALNANTSNTGAGNATMRTDRGPVLANTFVYTGIPTASLSLASSGIGVMGSSVAGFSVAALTFNGTALRGHAIDPTGFGLVTVGRVQIQGQGAGVNRVLTSNNVGDATWETLAASGGVSGTGTLNFIPKWTPDGVTIGNSQLFDNGTNVGLGTVSPNGRFDIQNTSGTVRGAFISNTSTTNQSSALFVQSNNVTGGGASLERSALSSLISPLNAPTYDYGAPTAIKGFASPSASLGSAGGIGVLGSSGAGYGVAAVSGTGTALLAQSATGGYAVQTVGRVQIIGQGAAAGNVLTSDATGNATWQENTAQSVGISGHYFTGTLTIPSNVITPVTQWTNLIEDGGANYNPLTGEYTITKTGVYQVNAGVVFDPFTANASFSLIGLVINGLTLHQGNDYSIAAGRWSSPKISISQRFNAGDVLYVTLYHNSGANEIVSSSYYANQFSIQFVHK